MERWRAMCDVQCAMCNVQCAMRDVGKRVLWSGCGTQWGKNSCKGSGLRVPCNGDGCGDGATRRLAVQAANTNKYPPVAVPVKKPTGKSCWVVLLVSRTETRNERGRRRRSGSTFAEDADACFAPGPETGALPGWVVAPTTLNTLGAR